MGRISPDLKNENEDCLGAAQFVRVIATMNTDKDLKDDFLGKELFIIHVGSR
ncbi:hypothetical protein KC799_20075 [candidate division KSB1 bacterium]|nr:hypothetical protein [candidate division KSB1 bacterium]